MVRYVDPETHPEGLETRRTGSSPGERLARARERNAALTGVEAVEAARDVALRKLDVRPCSRGELRQSILQRGFDGAVADDVLDRLERVGLVDDAAYAAAIVRERFGLGKVGLAVREELRRRFIEDDVAERALSQVNHDDERQRAAELVASKLRSMRGADREAAFRRLTGMLARRGFSPHVCVSVVTDALAIRDASQGF